MEIRNNAEALKAFLGVSAPASTQSPPARSNDTTGVHAGFDGDQASLSRAGSEVSESASTGGFRADKVAAIQQALAAGIYNVPASVVAGKVIETMLEGGVGRGV